MRMKDWFFQKYFFHLFCFLFSIFSLYEFVSGKTFLVDFAYANEIFPSYFHGRSYKTIDGSLAWYAVCQTNYIESILWKNFVRAVSRYFLPEKVF